MAVLNVLSGTLEGIGVTAVIPLFSILNSGVEASDSISRAIASSFQYLHLPYTVKFLLLFIVLLFIAKAAFLLLSQQLAAWVTADFEKKTRSELLQLTFGAGWPFLSRQKVGHLDQMLSTEVNNSSGVLLYMSNGMVVVVNLFVYSFLVFNISPIIAVLSLLFGIVTFFAFLPLLHKTRSLSEKMVKANRELAHFVNEHILGSKTIKAMSLEEPAYKKGESYGEVMRYLFVKISFIKNGTAVLLQLLGVFFVGGLFAFLYKTSTFEFASFAVVVFALNRVFSNIRFSQSSVHAISTLLPYVASITRYKEEAIKEKESLGGGEAFSFEHELEFKDVDFKYRADEPALSSVSFSIKKGQMVGMIGPSGAGKTTIVDLLLRLITPESGYILLDGKDISGTRLKDWRENVGYVSQDIFLFNDTVEANIKLYNPSISNDDMVQAMKMANVYDFVQELPQREKTVVGERGVSLSGGQRQRIVLARVLIRRPQVLILDEATSALDNESEVLIQKSIEALRGETTVVTIAHRLSTVMISDSLIVIEKGRIAECGSPKELLKDKESYFSKTYHLRAN